MGHWLKEGNGLQAFGMHQPFLLDTGGKVKGESGREEARERDRHIERDSKKIMTGEGW